MEQLIVELPLPPTLNKAYGTDFKTRRRFQSKEMAAFKEHAVPLVRVTARQLGFVPAHRRLGVQLVFYFDTKASHTRSDIDNRCKPTLDALASALDFNDNQIDRIELRRGEYDGRSRTLVLLEVLECPSTT